MCRRFDFEIHVWAKGTASIRRNKENQSTPNNKRNFLSWAGSRMHKTKNEESFTPQRLSWAPNGYICLGPFVGRACARCSICVHTCDTRIRISVGVCVTPKVPKNKRKKHQTCLFFSWALFNFWVNDFRKSAATKMAGRHQWEALAGRHLRAWRSRWTTQRKMKRQRQKLYLVLIMMGGPCLGDAHHVTAKYFARDDAVFLVGIFFCHLVVMPGSCGVLCLLRKKNWHYFRPLEGPAAAGNHQTAAAGVMFLTLQVQCRPLSTAEHVRLCPP